MASCDEATSAACHHNFSSDSLRRVMSTNVITTPSILSSSVR